MYDLLIYNLLMYNLTKYKVQRTMYNVRFIDDFLYFTCRKVKLLLQPRAEQPQDEVVSCDGA